MALLLVALWFYFALWLRCICISACIYVILSIFVIEEMYVVMASTHNFFIVFVYAPEYYQDKRI